MTRNGAAWLIDAWRAALMLVCFAGLAVALGAAASQAGARTTVGAVVMVVVAALSYGASHLLRALRLAVLVSGRRVPLKRLISLQLLSGGLGMALPWKLSEAVLLFELAGNTRSIAAAVAAVVIARSFDFACAILFFWTLPRDAGLNGEGLLWLWSAVVGMALVLFWVVPERIPALKLFILQRYQGQRAYHLLRAARILEKVGGAGHRVLRQEPALITTLTIGIWALELMAIAVATGRWSPAAAVAGLLTLLSEASGQEVMVQRVADGAATPYQLIITIVALALGSVFGAAYLVFSREERIRWSDQHAERKGGR